MNAARRSLTCCGCGVEVPAGRSFTVPTPAGPAPACAGCAARQAAVAREPEPRRAAPRDPGRLRRAHAALEAAEQDLGVALLRYRRGRVKLRDVLLAARAAREARRRLELAIDRRARASGPGIPHLRAEHWGASGALRRLAASRGSRRSLQTEGGCTHEVEEAYEG